MIKCYLIISLGYKKPLIYPMRVQGGLTDRYERVPDVNHVMSVIAQRRHNALYVFGSLLAPTVIA